MTVLSFANGARVGALAAQHFVPVHAFDAMRLAKRLPTLETADSMLAAQCSAAGDTCHTAMSTQDTTTGNAAGIEQDAALAVAVRAIMQAVGAVGLSVDDVGGIKIGAQFFAAATASHDALGAEALPAAGAGFKPAGVTAASCTADGATCAEQLSADAVDT